MAKCKALTGSAVKGLSKTNLRSLDLITANRVLMKIFKTGDVEIVQECQVFFSVASFSMAVGSGVAICVRCVRTPCKQNA